MTTLATVPTGPQSVLTTNTAPTSGTITAYNASAGNLAVTLPALSGLNVGARYWVEKYALDGTYNTVTFTASGADTFDDLETNVFLTAPGEQMLLQVMAIGVTKFWKRLYAVAFPYRGGISTLSSAFSLSNSTANTAIISATLPASLLVAGATFRVSIKGTIQTLATSGTLTFTPSIQGTALTETCQMASTVSANAASPFFLDYIITVRTTGGSGTAVASPWGQINLATTGNVWLTSTTTSTTTISTLLGAGSNVINVAAQWATASASNVLTVVTGSIERIR